MALVTREQARRYANAIRKLRADDKQRFKAGDFDLMIDRLMNTPDHWKNESVVRFLGWIRNGGPYRADDWCTRTNVAPGGRVGRLTDRQRTALANELRRFQNSPRRRGRA